MIAQRRRPVQSRRAEAHDAEGGVRRAGSLGLRRREPRKGRNPKTGDKVDVPPKKVPYFKPGKELKELINKEPAPATTPVGEPGAPPDAMAV